MKTFLSVCLLGAAASAFAQSDAEIAARRAVLERQQQSEVFSLELLQSQRRLGRGGADQDAADLQQKLEQDRLNQSQLLRSTLPGEPDAGFERERRAQALHSSAIPVWQPSLAPPRRWTPTLEER